MPTLKDLIDQVKTQSADAFESVKERVTGLRGGTPKPATATSVVPYDPVQGQRFAPPNDPPRIDGVRNPNVGPGRMSAEAKAFQASRQPAGQVPTKPTGGVRGLARGIGKSIGPSLLAYGGVSAAVDAAQNGNTDWDYKAADMFWPSDKGIMGDIGHATSPIRAAGAGAARRFAEAFGMDPSGRLAQQRVQPAAQIASGTGATIPAKPVDDDLIDTTRGARLTPDQLMKGTAVPVEGQGAFQRTTPGNRGVATKVGARSGTITAGAGAGQAGGLRLPKATTLGGHMVNLAALNAQAQASAARERGAAAETSLGIKAATAGAGIAKTKADLKKMGDDSLAKEIDAEVMRGTDPKMPKEEREALTSKQKGELSARIAHSAANRGIDTADLKPQQVRQLMLANRIRDKIENNWESLPQQVRDFFGNKRITSDDLFHYMPEVVGKEIHFGGNRLPLDKIMGGTFNFFGPNDPVNRDMMELIQEAQKRSKGK